MAMQRTCFTAASGPPPRAAWAAAWRTTGWRSMCSATSEQWKSTAAGWRSAAPTASELQPPPPPPPALASHPAAAPSPGVASAAASRCAASPSPQPPVHRPTTRSHPGPSAPNRLLQHPAASRVDQHV